MGGTSTTIRLHKSSETVAVDELAPIHFLVCFFTNWCVDLVQTKIKSIKKYKICPSGLGLFQTIIIGSCQMYSAVETGKF